MSFLLDELKRIDPETYMGCMEGKIEEYQRTIDEQDKQIVILRTELCAAQKNIERRDADIEALMTELAQLQENNRYLQTMIDDAHSIMGESQLAFAVERSVLAKELGIQINQEEDMTAAYLLGSQKANERLKVLREYTQRLETDYLTWVREYYRDLGEYEAITRAQAALEKIRHAD